MSFIVKCFGEIFVIIILILLYNILRSSLREKKLYRSWWWNVLSVFCFVFVHYTLIQGRQIPITYIAHVVVFRLYINFLIPFWISQSNSLYFYTLYVKNALYTFVKFIFSPPVFSTIINNWRTYSDFPFLSICVQIILKLYNSCPLDQPYSI